MQKLFDIGPKNSNKILISPIKGLNTPLDFFIIDV